MISKEHKVLVTGIGGNVGQGIIRNIRKTSFPISVIGTNIVSFSAGNHLCDEFYLVPYAYDEAYISTIQSIVEKEKVDLIIPSTDYEVYYLMKNQSNISCPVAASAASTAEKYLDKYKTYLHHQKHNIPFGKAYLPSEYDQSFDEFIAKPRAGRGSRGLHINPKSIAHFSDEEYMIQELIRGQEITTAFYVNKKQELHGFITFERELLNGATNECRVTFDYDERLKPILDQLIAHANFKGAANVQSIVDQQGNIIPFEINCRISGTNSIRANFGFEDVKYTLQEYLYDTSPDTVKVQQGVAIRVLMDVIYPNAAQYDELVNNKQEHYLY